MFAQAEYAGSTQIHRVQREIYNKVLLPLVKMENYPIQNYRISQPILGSYIRGFKDPAVTAFPQAWNRLTRKPYQYDAAQMLNEPEIPGVPGSGRRGKEIRDKQQQEKNTKFHQMGDANADPDALRQLQQLVNGGGGGGAQVQQSAQQGVRIPNQMQWR